MQSVRTWRSACSAARRKASRSPVVRYLRAPSSVCSAMPVCGRGAGVARLVGLRTGDLVIRPAPGSRGGASALRGGRAH